MPPHPNPLDSLALPPFRPFPGLGGGRRMTLANLAPRPALRAFARSATDRLFEVRDGSRVLARCHAQPGGRPAATLVLLHGLTGSADSPYVVGTALQAHASGLNVLRLHMRNQGGTEALARTVYHGGLSSDPADVLAELAREDGAGRLYLAGFSLGGNVALRLAGTLGDALPRLAGVVAVSAPIDLAACAARLERGPFERRAAARFLAGFRRAYESRARHWPGEADLAGARRIRTLREWDDRYTAPLAGYRDADAYYADASALTHIAGARVPCLALHAADDPLVDPAAFEAPAVRGSGAVRVAVLPSGGHLAFLGAAPALGPRGTDPGRHWAESRVVDAVLHLEAAHGAPVRLAETSRER